MAHRPRLRRTRSLLAATVGGASLGLASCTWGVQGIRIIHRPDAGHEDAASTVNGLFPEPSDASMTDAGDESADSGTPLGLFPDDAGTGDGGPTVFGVTPDFPDAASDAGEDSGTADAGPTFLGTMVSPDGGEEDAG